MEGTFVLPEETGPRILADTLGDLAEEVEIEDGLVLRRTLTREGRSRCYVGGVSVPVRALASLGQRLVSFHGQREQTRLTEPAEQLAILDDFLDLKPPRRRGSMSPSCARWIVTGGARGDKASSSAAQGG